MFSLSPDRQNNQSLWAISWVSFFWSMASVMVFTLLPMFLTDVLGASKTKLGIIEGVAVFLAFVAKVFSGILSDYWKSRTSLIIVGSIGSILIKPMFALAYTIPIVFLAKSIDRLSKGIRSAPTEALIADLSPYKKEGGSYGTRYSFYMMGAVCGGIIASAIMHVSPHNYRLVFWLSTLPAACALFLLYRYVTEPKKHYMADLKHDWDWRDIRLLPSQFWVLLSTAFILMLARFSEAFLTLRAKDLGWSIAALPLLMVLYDLIHALSAFPIGRLADRFNRKKILLTGILILTLTNMVMIIAPVKGTIFCGMLLAGLHMGMTQGLLSALVAESTLPHLRGTAFALYYLVTGLAVLIGNGVAGYLSDVVGGAVGAFWGGLFFTTVAAVYLSVLIWKHKPISNRS